MVCQLRMGGTNCGICLSESTRLFGSVVDGECSGGKGSLAEFSLGAWAAGWSLYRVYYVIRRARLSGLLRKRRNSPRIGIRYRNCKCQRRNLARLSSLPTDTSRVPQRDWPVSPWNQHRQEQPNGAGSTLQLPPEGQNRGVLPVFPLIERHSTEMLGCHAKISQSKAFETTRGL